MTDWGMPSEGHAAYLVWSLLPAAIAGQYAWNVGAEQNGETFKPHFVRGAKKFIDDIVFDGKNVSEYLYRAANYYLLEPDRVHCGTMCGELLAQPLDSRTYAGWFDIAEWPDDFYYDNVVNYMKKIVDDFSKIDFDETIKREMRVNCLMTIISAELCKVRISQKVTKEKYNELCALIDETIKEHCELWTIRNYPKGLEVSLGVLEKRRAELLARVI